ncbi:double-stranded RNA-binding protein 1-like [Macadamia integrifolia]|uniref:double-stranded RNA-binding protein 1-like n=1 Tax=Macadamia integrifolia TaxID=60698 RepID=UPI001C4F7C57|nr:double-stranded RNA-binding protein 1-like [Macadamia integrifolia]
MYKTRLQELCHERGWRLPSYSSVKDGPDHNPQFAASVTVNDLSFPTTGFCRTSKEAQNEAARIAFDHFNSPTPPPPPSHRPQLIFTPHHIPVEDASTSLSGSSLVSNEMKVKARNEWNNAPAVGGSKLPKNQEISRSPLTHENASVVKDEFEGIQFLYKNQLQSYAQRRNISLPTYSCVREGLAHALRFKATVTIDGQTFESPECFQTLKEAEHAAAKAALMTLSSDGTEMGESVVYKNLLQELTQKEGFSLPVYATTVSGESHLPTFSSTVEVGEVFHGKAAKTKKQAEMNAAKVAYSDLKERRLSRMAKYPCPSGQEIEATAFTSSSSNSVNSGHLQQNLKPIDMSHMTISTRVTVSKDHGEESRDGDQEVDSANAISVSAKVSTDDSIPSSKPSNMMTRNMESSSSGLTYCRLRDPFPSPGDEPSSPSTASDCSGNLAVASDIKVPNAKETSSLLCNRVRVYPRMPNMELTQGVTILPISDDKWVAVSLEFQDLAVQ